MSGNNKPGPPAVAFDGVALLKRLRDIVDPPGMRGTWLRHLNDRQLGEVYQRLSMGQPCYKIIKIAQQDWGIGRDSNIKSLTRAMVKFRDQALGEIKAIAAGHGTKVEKEVSKSLKSRADKVGGKINVLGKVAWLIEIQEERVEMLFKRERIALPFKHTDFTIRTMLDLIKDYTDLAIKLGVQDEIPREFNVKVQHEFGEVMSRVVGSGGAKVVNALGRFLDLAREHSEKLVYDEETNTYILESDVNAGIEPTE